MPPYTLLLFLPLVFFINRYAQNRRRNPLRLPHPPGPKGFPIIGNLLDMSWSTPWLVFDKLSKQYGDIVYLEIFGQPFVILSSVRSTKDLFDKRSAVYSSRPYSTMMLELMDFGYNMSILPYGPFWRSRRRTFHEYFHPNAVHQYKPVQLEQARSLLLRLLETPEDFSAHIVHVFASLVMKIVYGAQIKGEDDPYLRRAEVVFEGGNAAGTPGSFLVDFFPFLKYVPAWVPGASFKRKAAEWAVTNHDMRTLPFEATLGEAQHGTAPDSFAKSLIDKLPPQTDPSYKSQRSLAEDVTAITYIAGAHTTTTTVDACFLALAMHPRVLKRAQEEIDRVVGNDRLPDFSDQSSLPYIKAIAMETLRWMVVLPAGIPHATTEDDIYRDYFIPKGTIVFGNSWSILHDPEAFDDPFTFNPDRYIKDGKFNEDTRSPHCAAFGYGRRICPGRYMSDNSLYAIIASVVAVFDVMAPLDDNGNLVQLNLETTTGILIHAVPFKCRIKPRNSKAEALIRDSNAEWGREPI